MQGKSKAKVVKVCLTIMEGYVMEMLNSLAIKDCKKPVTTKGKNMFVSLLDAVASFKEHNADTKFFCEDLSESAEHCRHLVECATADPSKLKAALDFVSNKDSPGQDSPLVKALQAHANGIALIMTATATLAARSDDIKLEETVALLDSEHEKLKDESLTSDNFLKIAEEISKHSGEATKLSKKSVAEVKQKVKAKVSNDAVAARLGRMLDDAFDAAVSLSGQELQFDLDKFSAFVEVDQLAKLQKKYTMMQHFVELNTWEQIAKSNNKVDMLVAAGDKFEKWQRIDMKKLETWKVTCLPRCKELLAFFTEKAAEVSHVMFGVVTDRSKPSIHVIFISALS